MSNFQQRTSPTITCKQHIRSESASNADIAHQDARERGPQLVGWLLDETDDRHGQDPESIICTLAFGSRGACSRTQAISHMFRDTDRRWRFDWHDVVVFLVLLVELCDGVSPTGVVTLVTWHPPVLQLIGMPWLNSSGIPVDAPQCSLTTASKSSPEPQMATCPRCARIASSQSHRSLPQSHMSLHSDFQSNAKATEVASYGDD